MWTFVWSGMLYLIGVTALLILRPSLMFDDQGQWKEFRIGGDRDKYTWMPIWLALLLWALFCYFIVTLIMKKNSGATSSYSGDNIGEDIEEVVKIRKGRGKRIALPPGYYILDKEANNRTGTPHYVYIGEQPGDE